MSFLIRPYQPEDAPAVREIINDSILHTFHNYDYEPKSLDEVSHLFETKLKDGFPVLVGVIDEEICGYATFGKFRAKPGYNTTVEHSIYLNEKAQGHVLGSEMMRQIINLARQQGYHVMIAGMDSGNLGSYRFHQRLGFKEVARFPEVAFKFNKWLTLIFMQLIVSEAKDQISIFSPDSGDGEAYC